MPAARSLRRGCPEMTGAGVPAKIEQTGPSKSRALAGIAALYVIVFLAFLLAQHQGNLIAATNVQNPSLHPAALHCVTGYPCFYPAGYAFDLVVPLINIHPGRLLAGQRASLARLGLGTRHLDGNRTCNLRH
jgi:hypothetical protein